MNIAFFFWKKNDVNTENLKNFRKIFKCKVLYSDNQKKIFLKIKLRIER